VAFFLYGVPIASVFRPMKLSSVVDDAFLAFLFSRLSARAEAKREHPRWLTGRWFEAYRNFLVTAEECAIRATGRPTLAGGTRARLLRRHDRREAAVELVGPQETPAVMSPIRSALLHLQDEREPRHESASMFYWDKQPAFTAVDEKPTRIRR
jgi:hypothetical protein